MTDDGSGVTDVPESEETQRLGGIRWFAVVVLVTYLALLAIGAWSLWVIAGGGLTSWIAASVFSALYVLGWRVWLAPGSRMRLAFRERTTLHMVAGPIVVVLGSLAQVWLPAVLALSALVMCDALNERGR